MEATAANAGADVAMHTPAHAGAGAGAVATSAAAMDAHATDAAAATTDARAQLYEWMAKQLLADGHADLARQLAATRATDPQQAQQVQPQQPLLQAPSDALLQWFSKRGTDATTASVKDAAAEASAAAPDHDADTVADDADHVRFPNYVSPYLHTHEHASRCAAFHPDGSLLATGGDDARVKVLQVQRIRQIIAAQHAAAHQNAAASSVDRASKAAAAAAAAGATASSSSSSSSFSASSTGGGRRIPILNPAHEDHATPTAAVPQSAITRNYRDHTQGVFDVSFHPFEPFIVTASADATLKFFDYARVQHRQAYAYLSEGFPVRSVHFHPTGDYIVVGTDHPFPRIYNVVTFQGYVPRDEPGMGVHSDALRQVRFNATGSMYATASRDGDARIWDTRTSRCVQTLAYAHSGNEVVSAQFSNDSSLLVTSGRDNTVKLWDVASGRLVHSLGGIANSHHAAPAIFDFTQRFVLSADEKDHHLVVWDAATGSMVKRLGGHSMRVVQLCASPTEPMFVSCAEDGRARSWVVSPSLSRS